MRGNVITFVVMKSIMMATARAEKRRSAKSSALLELALFLKLLIHSKALDSADCGIPLISTKIDCRIGRESSVL